MSWDRIQRQEAILREKIAVLVQRLNDPRLGFITVTAVKLSRDKRHCRVDYTVLGDEAQIRTTTRALEDAAGRIQELLAPSLRMRTMPELRFHYDAKVEKHNRLLDLIEKVAEEHQDGDAPADGDVPADGDAPADGDVPADSGGGEELLPPRAPLVDEFGDVPDVPAPAAAWAGEALRAAGREEDDEDEAAEQEPNPDPIPPEPPAADDDRPGS